MAFVGSFTVFMSIEKLKVRRVRKVRFFLSIEVCTLIGFPSRKTITKEVPDVIYGYK